VLNRSPPLAYRPADFRGYDRTALEQIESSRQEFLPAFLQIVEMTASRPVLRVLATRGERLLLADVRWLSEDVSASEIDWLLLFEVNATGDITAILSFDPNDKDAAYAELDARYGADASAAPAHRHNRAFLAALGACDWTALGAICAPSFVEHDRRSLALLGSTRGAEEWTANFRAQVALAPDTMPRFHHLRHNRRGYLAQFSWLGSRDGGDYEIPMIVVVELDANGQLMPRCDLHEPEQYEQALVRFDALTGDGEAASREHPFANAASRTNRRRADCFNARDWVGVEACAAPDLVFDERRRLLRNTADREVWLAQMRLLFDVPESRFSIDLRATRGEHLSLHLHRFEGVVAGGGGPLAVDDHFALHEVDHDGRIVAIVLFDLEDEDAACTELDARFRARAEHPLAARWVDDFRRGFAARDWAGLGADAHGTGRTFARR